MTFYISVTEIDRLPKGGILFVEGSRAGLLSSPPVSSSQRFSPPFLVKSAVDDVLTFKVAKNVISYENNDFFASGVLHGPVLNKRYRNQLLGISNMYPQQQVQQPQQTESFIRKSLSKLTNPQTSNSQILAPNGTLPYEIELYGQDGITPTGIVYCTIKLDRASHFQGEFCTGAQRQAIKNGRKVALFKGKCPTKNLFSLMDPACEGQENKFIESIYKDGEEEYVM